MECLNSTQHLSNITLKNYLLEWNIMTSIENITYLNTIIRSLQIMKLHVMNIESKKTFKKIKIYFCVKLDIR